MFRLAHLTDPHVGPLPRPRLREMLNKRVTGWYNWRRSRKGGHDMDLLTALVEDLRAQGPDHVACTGDVCNIGLPREWPTARVFMEGLGSPDGVSFVPGNHDAYVQGSLEGLLRAIGPWTRGDDGQESCFPYLRRRGPLALVGLSSAIPTLPFVASGKVGSRQMAVAERLLDALKAEGVFRVVMIHHPPTVDGAASGRNLLDARKFERMIGRVGAELVLHGHNHVGSVAFLDGAGHPVPVVGAPSASARGGGTIHKAGYHLYTILRSDGGWQVRGELRGCVGSQIGTVSTLQVERRVQQTITLG